MELHFYIQIGTGLKRLWIRLNELHFHIRWNSLSGILAPGSYSHRPLIRIRRSTPSNTCNWESQNIRALGKCLPSGESYRTTFKSVLFASGFREKGLVGHRLLTTERIVNKRVLALDLVGKVGVRHVPCLRIFWVGHWRSHSSRLPLSPDFTLSTLVYFIKSQACPYPCL